MFLARAHISGFENNFFSFLLFKVNEIMGMHEFSYDSDYYCIVLV